MTPAEMVREFHETYGAVIASRPTLGDKNLQNLRFDLVDEEVSELEQALRDEDIVEVADALGDIAYVVYGAALSFGIDLDAVLTEIHRSNMSKLDDNGDPIRRADGKILKGVNYFRPDLRKVLAL